MRSAVHIFLSSSWIIVKLKCLWLFLRVFFFCFFLSWNLSSSAVFESRAVKTEKHKSNQYLLEQFLIVMLNHVVYVLSFPSIEYYLFLCIFLLKVHVSYACFLSNLFSVSVHNFKLSLGIGLEAPYIVFCFLGLMKTFLFESNTKTLNI